MSSARQIISRRSILKTGALSGASLLIGFHLPFAFAQDSQQAAPNPFNAWIRIDADNTVTLTAPLAELGEGLATAIPMMLAEELELDWSKIRVVRAPFHRGSRPSSVPSQRRGRWDR